MKIKEMAVRSYLTASKLPDADYVINPYVGCTHKCIYCYAEFMKRFTNHKEDWGSFLDIKVSDIKSDYNKKEGTSILIGSVTDAYNAFEKKYGITREILKNLLNAKCHVEVLTKSDLVLRDIDLFKQIADFRVGISLNTLDDSFRKKIEPGAPNIQRRINALKELHMSGIKTCLFMSPIFPEITNFKQIIDETKDFVDFFCFENLNLRGAYASRVLNLINQDYQHLNDIYKEIYKNKNMVYWENMSNEIDDYCLSRKLNYKLYFYHEKIRKA
ncbi:radical SAM protein [Dysgonomonas capnocytophagoides]|nr:radical SAM protein [Dysgonomonas capnocytophagoides]